MDRTQKLTCEACDETFDANTFGKLAKRCPKCRKHRKPSDEVKPYGSKGSPPPAKRMFRCLAPDHDHYFLTTSNQRLCKSGKYAQAQIDPSPSMALRMANSLT